jgi:hypothetical protein
MAFKKPKLADTVDLLDRPPMIEGLSVQAAQAIKLWTVGVCFASALLEGEGQRTSQAPAPKQRGPVPVRSTRPLVQFEYVFEIVDYLVRYDRFPDGRDRFKLEDAKDFVWAKRGKVLKVRTVEKYWEENRLAAPYIYALFRLRYIHAVDLSPHKAAAGLTKLFSNERRVRRLFGHAAYAADVLAKLVDQRERDFKDIERVCPPVAPFSAEELDLVPTPSRLEPIE